MKTLVSKTSLAALALLICGTTYADYGVGIKAGTLGIGIEGRWKALPWFDVRMGMNSYEYDDSGSRAGINYDATFSLDSLYATGNIHFPLSPLRVTAGFFANGNEFGLVSTETNGAQIFIGEQAFDLADVGTLRSVTSFESTAPYLGVGFDFEVLRKVGFNIDFGVLWQGDPSVSLQASGLESAPSAVRDQLRSALDVESVELEEEMSDFKAWPVISLGFNYNF